jgi:hypothetical protein
MQSFRNKYVAGPLALLVALVVTTSIALASGGVAASSPSAAPAASAARSVAHTGQGDLRSRIVGETADGRRVTGYMTPLKFSRHDGKVFVRGLIHGVVHNPNGTTRTFDVLRTRRVQTIEGVPISTRAPSGRALAAAPACDVLNLVLGPLHLDLLGLVVDLDRVVLNIVAQSGAGNLLGNLLCAVAGLLDGGLGGALGRITNLLNQILGRLGLGL